MFSTVDLTLIKQLEKFKQNEAVANLVRTIIKDLNTAEVLSFLRLKGRATIQFSSHPIENCALQGAHNSGYQQCLDDLENFVEFFIQPAPIEGSVAGKPILDFGGIKKAYERGDITKEEYERRTNHRQ